MFLGQCEAMFRHLVTDFPPCFPRAFVICRVKVTKGFFGDYGKSRQDFAYVVSFTVSQSLQNASNSRVEMLAKVHCRGEICKRAPHLRRKMYFYIPVV